MTSLLAMELRRAASRRLVLACLLGGVLLMALVGVLTFLNTADSVVAGNDRRFHAVEMIEEDGVPGFIAGAAAPLILASVVIGASLIGAEWRFSTIGTLLTWEPRRGSVLTAKALAAGIVGFTFTIALLAVFVLAMTPAALWHGTTAGLDSALVMQGIGLCARGALLAAGGAMLGLAIASVGRNTAAALGAAFAYVVIVEQALRAWKDEWAPWFLIENIGIFFSGDRLEASPLQQRSPAGAGLLLAVYVAAAVVAAAAVFRRRDVA